MWRFDGANWTWIAGSSVPAEGVSYGIKGVPSTSNTPGARYSPSAWIGSNDTLWLFGGYYSIGSVTGPKHYCDLWKFDGNWTWISGPNLENQAGQYGIKGVTNATNFPGGRGHTAFWKQSNNLVWIFGGYGYDSTGIKGEF